MMNQQAILQASYAAPDFSYVSGSKLYGTNRPASADGSYAGSDDDVRGFIVPPKAYLLGILNFEQYEAPDCDTKYYSLKKFIGLLANGCPQTMECLFAPKEKILTCNHFGESLLANKHMFISKTIYKRLVGYSYSEMRKAMCEKVEYAPLPPQYDALRCQLVDYARTKNATKEDTDLMLEQFDQFRESKIVTSVANLGAKRKADYDKHGFCTSSAAHSIRLVGQLIELLETGHITFPRQNAQFLKDIRNGLVSKEECKSTYEALLVEADKAEKVSKLPAKANMDAINQWYYNNMFLCF